MTEVLFTNIEFLKHESDIKGRVIARLTGGSAWRKACFPQSHDATDRLRIPAHGTGYQRARYSPTITIHVELRGRRVSPLQEPARKSRFWSGRVTAIYKQGRKPLVQEYTPAAHGQKRAAMGHDVTSFRDDDSMNASSQGSLGPLTGR